MVNPNVSVVIATRNRPRLLRRAVSSVLAQKGVGQIEVIVVFDGTSIDPLADLTHEPHRLRMVSNSRTPGLAGARNTGILHAAAGLIAFCDDDDEWKPNKLRLQLPLFADPRVILAATGIEIHSSRGVHVRRAPGSVGLDDLLESRITELHPSSFVLRTEALRGTLGLVDEELPASYGEDYDLLLRAAKAGHIRAVPEAQTIVHWDRTSYFTDKWQGIADGLSYLLAKHPEFVRSAIGQSRVEGQIAFAHAALGDRPSARSWARRAIDHHIRQPRAYLALAVGLGLVSPNRLVAALNGRGRGM